MLSQFLLHLVMVFDKKVLKFYLFSLWIYLKAVPALPGVVPFFSSKHQSGHHKAVSEPNHGYQMVPGGHGGSPVTKRIYIPIHIFRSEVIGLDEWN
ncbi:MAG: hypothetical protein DRH34_14885 [Deltaproteobacteria bacterium]|nr:MAG: hypothetical protein DRH34_14885 [Deltaproteobacteria bacterium]